ncbi:hypothetical protein JKF63_01795 [Porcisia hertigi]|uniref:ADF-H domain-containing protein n=1 Tax=Porcisia hertigi TaxID=2761500 RepID=A0A836IGF2_9TRYP|nr:hypothetical protein JKF63_01795 [Porcisia hertigi]
MPRIELSMAPDVQQALRESGEEDTATVAVPLIIDEGVLHLLAPPVCSTGDGLEGVLGKTRTLLETVGVTAAYIVVRSAPGTQHVIMYVSSTASTVNRMLYSTGVKRLLEMTPGAKRGPVQIFEMSDLVPSLFETLSEEEQKDLMTEREREQAAIAEMDLAPQPVALPGVPIKLTPAADDMLTQFANGEVDVATFMVAAEELLLDQSVRQLDGDLDQLKSILSDAEPRFILLRYPSPNTQLQETVMVYMCPPTCSPQIKIQYASSVAAFRAEASRYDIKVTQKVETDTPATLVEDFHRSFEPFPSDGALEVERELQPSPPPSSAPKGHRMLL